MAPTTHHSERERRDAAADEPIAGTTMLPRLANAPIRVSGPDRLDFLQGQLSNDLRSLPVGAWQRALQLDHKGHVLASVGVFVREDDLYLAADAGGEALLASLRRHVIFDQVEIDDLSETLTSLALVGEGLPELLASVGLSVPAAGTFDSATLGAASVVVVAAPWSVSPAVEIHLLERDRSAVEGELAAAGAATVRDARFDALRIEAGYATAADAGSGVLPQEIGLDDAVSYRKGCYLGQEIMARIEARGSLRRGPARLTLSSLPAEGERDLMLDGRRVGRLGVAARSDGAVRALAALRTDLEAADRPTVGGVRVDAIERL